MASLCRAVLEQKPYKVRGLITFGLAPHTSSVDAARVDEALRALEFHVHCDYIREHPLLVMPTSCYPACSFPEREALRKGFEISEEAVEHLRAGLRPRW